MNLNTKNMKILKKIIKALLKFMGAFIVCILTSRIIDVVCLGGYVLTAHVISDFSFGNYQSAGITVSIAIFVLSLVLPLLWAGFGYYCANKSRITTDILIGYVVLSFLGYCIAVLSDEGQREGYVQLISMARFYAGDLYVVGAWISIFFALALYIIMGIGIYVCDQGLDN